MIKRTKALIEILKLWFAYIDKHEAQGRILTFFISIGFCVSMILFSYFYSQTL